MVERKIERQREGGPKGGERKREGHERMRDSEEARWSKRKREGEKGGSQKIRERKRDDEMIK